MSFLLTACSSGTSGSPGRGGNPSTDAQSNGSAGSDASVVDGTRASDGPSIVDAPTSEGGAWACTEAVGTLCICTTSSDEGAGACAADWTCCFAALGGAASHSCECLDLAEADCATTVALDARLMRVPRCPP